MHVRLAVRGSETRGSTEVMLAALVDLMAHSEQEITDVTERGAHAERDDLFENDRKGQNVLCLVTFLLRNQ